MNIRTRLAFLFAILVATLMLAFAAGIYFLTADYRENEFYERLREKANLIAQLLFESNQQISPQTLQRIDRQDSTLLLDEQLSIFGPQRNLLYDSRNRKVKLKERIFRELKQGSLRELRKQENDREYLYLLIRQRNREIVVSVSAIDRYGLSKLNFLLLILLAGWATSVGVIVVSGWIFAGNALRPITDVIQQVEKINVETLDTRRVKAGNERDEIFQLAATFNRMLNRLQQSFVVQKSFVSNASHELRTPLTIMGGQIEVALLQDRPAGEYRSILRSVLEDVRETTDLANDLLDLAQASSDVSTLSFKTARIDELLLQAEAELLKKHGGYDAVVDFPEAPEEESLFELKVNERLLKNAFLNLMENACKFSDDKKVYVRVFFRPDAIRLEFADKGIGIADTDLPYVFEPFYRSENARLFSTGHGIGLHLTRKIVEAHQGEITVGSVLRLGTTFSITLPRT